MAVGSPVLSFSGANLHAGGSSPGHQMRGHNVLQTHHSAEGPPTLHQAWAEAGAVRSSGEPRVVSGMIPASSMKA
jgi:hypothetical protein